MASGGGTPKPVIPAPIVDLRGDTDRSGAIDEVGLTDDALEELWTADAGAVLLANLDDDDSRCPKSGTDLELAKCSDGADEVVDGDSDLLDLAPLKVLAWPKAPDGAKGTLSVSSAAESKVRLFRPVQGANDLTSSAQWSAFHPDTDVLSTADLRAGVELRIEAKDIVRNRDTWNGTVGLVLTVTTPLPD